MGNQNSGRRPTPTALHILRGNPSKKRLNECEPAPDGHVERPKTLSAGAIVTWDRMAPVCIAMRTLTAADVDTFGVLCELQAALDWVRLAKDSSNEKAMLEAIALEIRLAPIIRPYYGLFGMDPSSRTKIQVAKAKPDEPQSKWAGVLK